MGLAAPPQAVERDPERHYRVCTLCEAMCGLEIEHAGGEVLAIRGDGANQFSKGHICPKGNAIRDLHADEDRVRFPLRRTASGAFERVDWDEALDDIADRITAIRSAHGRDAIGLYVGNPTAHHLGALATIFPLVATLRTRNRFSATSQDQLPQSLAALKLFGHFGMFPIPDIDRTELFVCIGGNPLVSNGSLMSAPGLRHRIRALRERGGSFVVIDPRRSESADIADEHHFIRPGTDAWLMLALVNVLFAEGLAELGAAASYVDGLPELERLAAPFTPDAAERLTGIGADAIRSLARRLASAERAVVYGRVGICTQEFGGLAAWLQYVLNVITGNLDREGGMMFTTPAVDPLPIAAATGYGGSFDTYRSRVSKLPEFAGELPTATLAEELETPGAGQIRALLIHAGNPVLSAPNGSRIERALPGLDLLVCFDLYVTETTRHADYILPPASPLETAEYDLALNAVAVRNVAHFSPPLFDKPDGARHDWEAISGLTRRLLARGARGRRGRVAGAAWGALVDRLGAEGLLDLGLRAGPYGHTAGALTILERTLGSNALTRAAWHTARSLARRSPLRALLTAPPSSQLPAGVPASGLTLAALKRHPHGLDLGPLTPRLPARLFTTDKRVRLVDDIYAQDIARLSAQRPPEGLVLIGRRHLRSNNSWMHNSRRLVKGKDRCTLMIHPYDAAARAIEDGATVKLSSGAGAIELAAEITDTIMRGVVCAPHGWGHDRDGVGWRTARAHAGVSVNDVTDDRLVDRLCGTSVLNGVPVEVAATPPAGADVTGAFVTISQ